VTAEKAARAERLYEAKARAELKAADAILGRAVTVAGGGDVLGETVLVKGSPSTADRAARKALAGPDGEAVRKILEALELDPDSSWVFCSRPVEAGAAEYARRVEMVVEAVDPRAVFALDDEAAEDVAAAFGLPTLRPGVPVSSRGRTLGAVGDLARSLDRTEEKATVWARFKAISAAAATRT